MNEPTSVPPGSGEGAGRTGVARRTLIAGAAWSIPAIAVATAAPAHAASQPTEEPTLEFVNGPYNSAACAVLDDVVVRKTTDGTLPAAGETVTVTLPAGYTWSDGSTSPRSFTTDGDGQVVLDGIRVPATGTSGTFTAVSGSLTATAPSSVSTLPVAKYYDVQTKRTYSYSNVPPGSTTQPGSQTYIAPNGDLYWANKLIARGGVTSASSEIWGNNTPWVYFVQDGVAKVYNPATGVTSSYSQVPEGSTAVTGSQTYLAPDGSLWVGNTRIVARGVTSASSEVWRNDTLYVYYVWNGQAWYYNRSTGTHTRVPNIPVDPDMRAVSGSNTFLLANGDLWSGARRLARNVTSAAAEVWSNDYQYVYYIENGVAKYYREWDGSIITVPNVPADSVVQPGTYTYLAPNGDLYYGRELIASNVNSGSSEVWSDGRTFVYYTEEPAC